MLRKSNVEDAASEAGSIESPATSDSVWIADVECQGSIRAAIALTGYSLTHQYSPGRRMRGAENLIGKRKITRQIFKFYIKALFHTVESV